MTALLPGAAPFRFDNDGDVAALLIHGFTGTPAEMRPLAEALRGNGIASAGVLLTGHGTRPDDMVGVPYTQWIADCELAIDHLRERYPRIVMVGLSMGGTLALNLAARHREDQWLHGIIPMCAPLFLDDWRLAFLGVLGRLVKWQAWGWPDIKDVRAWEHHVGYRRYRPGTIQQLIELMAETRQTLSSVTVPTLVIQARSDHVVPPRNATIIASEVGAADVNVLRLDSSFHMVTLDYEARLVESEVARFIHHVTGASTAPPSR